MCDVPSINAQSTLRIPTDPDPVPDPDPDAMKCDELR
jgi:hypothetical protein